MTLDGQVAIVTGGGGEVGEGIARHFARLGASVVVADVRGTAAAQVAADINAAGGSAVASPVDVTKDADVAAMVRVSQELFGRLDIIVNSAGATHRNQPMLDVDEATFDRVFATNVKSLYLSARHTVPVFRQQGRGVIINIASTAGARPRPGLTWYNGSKGAAILLTKSMAAELAPDRIRVNAINPVMNEDTEATRQQVISAFPGGRLSRPEDIAKACAFLASSDADSITGVCMEVDGGRYR